MATYSGIYTLDVGIEQKAASLRVFVVEIVLGDRSKFDGNVIQTSPDFDTEYLPNAFLNHISSGKPCCAAPVNTERHARCYFADNRYLFITCPFRGDSIQFLQFYRELVGNSKFILVEAHGETVGTILEKFL